MDAQLPPPANDWKDVASIDAAAPAVFTMLHAALAAAAEAGFVVTGDVAFVRPAGTAPRVRHVADATVRPIGSQNLFAYQMRVTVAPADRQPPVDAVSTAAPVAPPPAANGNGHATPHPPSSAYTGDSCASCGSVRMRRAGTCAVCEDCGTTGGCS